MEGKRLLMMSGFARKSVNASVMLALMISLIGVVVLGDEKSGSWASELAPELWIETFSDDFDGDRLDYDKWMPKDPWEVVRNEELQGYWIKAFHLEDGLLRIRAEDAASYYDGAKRDFRSGMMTTTRNFSQRFGRFEIRCRVPAGDGLWPAFWMLPEPPSWPPEIDVLEILGGEPHRLYMSHHWSDAAKGGKHKAQTGEFAGPDFSESFHVFTVVWRRDEIRWYVDGVLRHQSDEEVPQIPMFLLVNLAIGGWAGPPSKETSFPADFEVDYVRVWRERE
ncbi:MAG: glycoside hydrolase family 16 protein [Verrucomicrobiota bacterium]